MANKTYIVTGGLGFIGSNFVNYLCDSTDCSVIIIDSITYAANPKFIKDKHFKSGRARTLICDISTDLDALDNIFKLTKINGVFNFAAETHVDNSITGPRVFIKTNIEGTFNLIDCVRRHSECRYLQISTDEVYGSLSKSDPSFTENTNLSPSSVYSSSKASADLIINSFHATYGVDTIITRCCNNYGPHQHVEKLIPKTILAALGNRDIPVYGKGDNIREWIHVYDHCTAIKRAFDIGTSGDVYNIGSGVETDNITIVKKILHITKKPLNLIKFVKDRLGHDLRYSIDSSKFRELCGNTWRLKYDRENFNDGLDQTILWYRENHKKA